MVTESPPVRLTRQETAAWEYLVKHPEGVTVDALAHRIYGIVDPSAKQGARVWIHRLRQKGIPVVTTFHRYRLGECEEHQYLCFRCGRAHSP